MKLLFFLLAPFLCAASGFQAYIGDTNPQRLAAMVTDAAGNSYLTGGRVFGNLLDVFVTKLDPSGNVIFTTTTGGKGSDTATSIAVDSNGNIWVGGNTTSPDFPLRGALQTQPGRFGTTGFLLKLAPDGTIVFASYFGGTAGASSVQGIAVDAAGNAYLTGQTSSSDYPVTAGMPSATVGTSVPAIAGAFVAKISADGGKVLYSGLISGLGNDCSGGSSCFLSARSTSGSAIAVDAAGDAYFAGNTSTIDLPATKSALYATGLGAFVAKVGAAGSGLSYLTYLGNPPPAIGAPGSPAPLTQATAIAVDSSGNAYVTGGTSDTAFPATANAYQKTFAGPLTPNLFVPPPSDAFALKLTPDGSSIVWATYIGGKGVDAAKAIAPNAAGDVWLAGTTQAPDFPNASGWSAGGDFIVELNATGSALPYSSRYPNNMVSTAIAVDGAGLIHSAGLDGLASSFSPSATPSLEIYGIANAAAGYLTGRIVPGEVISIYGPHIGPMTPVAFTGVSGSAPVTLGGVQVIVGGQPAPLLYVSDWQINAVVPFEAEGTVTSDVQVMFNNASSPKFTATNSPAELGIFTDGNGHAVFNSDGTANSASNPAPAGSAVSIWVTGIDIGNDGFVDGQIATSALNLGLAQWQVQVGTQVADILYAGSAPSLVNGIIQINFQVPKNSSGTVTLVVGNRTSQAVSFYATN